jgi:hypothetical protein
MFLHTQVYDISFKKHFLGSAKMGKTTSIQHNLDQEGSNVHQKFRETVTNEWKDRMEEGRKGGKKEEREGGKKGGRKRNKQRKEH